MLAADVDIRGFSRFVEGLQNALIGTGQDGDMMALVKSETRQLSIEISQSLGPRTKERGEKAIESDIRKAFRPGPVKAFEQSKRGHGDMVWLYAGPAFLVGINRVDLKPDIGIEFAQRVLRVVQAQAPRGNAWRRIGTHGRQAVQLLNRIIIGRQRYNELQRRLGIRVGRLRATFAFAAHELGYNRIPSWVARHFQSVRADGRAIFRYRVEGKQAVAIEFGSRAPGVVSNPRAVAAIHKAVSNRQHKIKEKMTKILQGYAYDFNTGAVFRPHRGEELLKQLENNEQMFDALN